MNLVTIFERFPDQEACIEHLERVRFSVQSYCPLCGGLKVARKSDGARLGRWNCRDCKSSFNVLSGTIMEKTKLPLQKWFLAIGIIVNAKKSVSSCQLARDLGMNQKSAWYMQQRIRSAMASTQGAMLQGIVEADETYVGGKPRKKNRRDDDTPNKRGRGTKKTPVLGAVERGGNVAVCMTERTRARDILRFIQKNVDPRGSVLVTDEYTPYRAVEDMMAHAVINHSRAYAEGATHTNTIESFWSLLKRAWFGSHHKYTTDWMPLFIGEQAWKWNHRRDEDSFGSFMRECFA